MPIPCLPTYSSLCPMWEGPTGGSLPGLGNSPLQPGSRERCKGSDWYPSIRRQGGVSSLAALSFQVPTASFLPSCYQPLGPGVLILGPTPMSGDGPGLALGLKEQHPVACSPSRSPALPLPCGRPLFFPALGSLSENLSKPFLRPGSS